MSFSWFFKEARPGDRARESQVEKFFNSDAVANRANAIVREGIQNSLDASQDGGVRVRIAIGAWSAEEAAKRLPVYFKGFDDHFAVEGVHSKIANPPAAGEEFRYLLFEDFGTSGLKGDPAQWWPDEQGAPNPFFNYFRAEGISDKTEGARGRHGVGRLVFMFASRIRSMFGLTRRSDGGASEEFLMGTSVLRNHWLEKKPYLPDGWFGIPDKSDSALILPINADSTLVKAFKKDFRISRETEDGLSVIVPWLSEDVTVEEVNKATIAGYFYPILRADLIAEVVNESGVISQITATTIEPIVHSLASAVVEQMKPLIALAKESLASGERIELALPEGTGAPKWDAAKIPLAAIQAIHDSLEAGQLAAIRVPMQVRLRGKPPAESEFTIFLKRDSSIADGQIHFIREGIIVSDVRPRRTSGIRALVVIDDGPLASFLGDSENPSHTQWQKDLVKDKYVLAPAHIDYVVQSVPSILSIVSQQQKKPDASLLIDLFSVPADKDHGSKTKQKKQEKNPGGVTVPPVIEIPKTPRRFTIDKRADGFVIRKGDPEVARPALLVVRVAYGVRRGSPFARYNPADFTLGDAGIQYSMSGCQLVDLDQNKMRIKVLEDDFEVAVQGFDTERRDLHVDVRVSEAESEAGEEKETKDAAPI